MSKVLPILGVVLIGVATAVGFFFDFSGDNIISIAIAFFGAGSIFFGIYKKDIETGKSKYVTIGIGACAAVGGLICAFGGVAENTITAIVGAVIAVISVIIGVVSAKK